MTSGTVVRSRIDKAEKERVEKIFEALGLTTSDAIRIFMRQVILHRGMPFEMKIPNKQTLKAMQSEPQKGDKTYADAADMLADLGLG